MYCEWVCALLLHRLFLRTRQFGEMGTKVCTRCLISDPHSIDLRDAVRRRSRGCLEWFRLIRALPAPATAIAHFPLTLAILCTPETRNIDLKCSNVKNGVLKLFPSWLVSILFFRKNRLLPRVFTCSWLRSVCPRAPEPALYFSFTFLERNRRLWYVLTKSRFKYFNV